MTELVVTKKNLGFLKSASSHNLELSIPHKFIIISIEKRLNKTYTAPQRQAMTRIARFILKMMRCVTDSTRITPPFIFITRTWIERERSHDLHCTL